MINDIYQTLLSLPLFTQALPWEITFLYIYSWEPVHHVMFNLVPPRRDTDLIYINCLLFGVLPEKVCRWTVFGPAWD